MRLSSRTQFLRSGTDINKINCLVQTTNLGVRSSNLFGRATSEYAIAAERWRFCVWAVGRTAPPASHDGYATFLRLGRINTSAEMPRRSCRRRIIAIDSPRFRLRTSAIRVRVPKISSRSQQSLLLHAELDHLNGIGQIHWTVLRLIRINQRRQNIQAIAVCCCGLRTPKMLDPF